MQRAKTAEHIQQQREGKEGIFWFAEMLNVLFSQWRNEVPGNISLVLRNALCLLELIIYKFICLPAL